VNSIARERIGDFEVLRAGPRDAPRVVVLHGFPDHPPTFAPVIERIAAAGYDVVAPWLRGYAPSILAGPYDPEQLARDALSLEPRYLVGHDWGAVATYAACALAPSTIRAAVTIAVPHPLAFLRSFTRTAQLARSWYMLAFQIPRFEDVAAARDFALIDRLWRRWSPDLSLDRAARDELHACLRASWPAPLLYYRHAARAAMRRQPIETITVPTLQLQGARDGCIARSACRDQARGFAGDFREEVIPRVGHFAHVEAPALVADRAVAWLARQ
jgi:pimeloyl-ACP methyl ester carboxylesterase